ncbi:MAG: META domain-containing protein [Chitinophagaceae bacterium]
MSSSCQSLSKSKTSASTKQLNGVYILTKQKSQTRLVSVGYKDTKIVIDDYEKTISCFVGCNTIQADFFYENGKIKPIHYVATEKACQDYILDLELDFLDNLSKANLYTWKEDDLMLYHNDILLMVWHLKE